MDKSLIIGIVALAIAGAALVQAITLTAQATAPIKGPAAPTGGPYQGYSSYEEMMQAHHGGGAGGGGMADHHGAGSEEPGCGEIANATGEMTAYGVTLDSAGYQQLLQYENTIQLSSADAQKVVGLDVALPCCGFAKLQASGNCECGHHLALFGLAKLLASQDYSREQIQTEIDKWKQVFFPAGSSGTGGC